MLDLTGGLVLGEASALLILAARHKFLFALCICGLVPAAVFLVNFIGKMGGRRLARLYLPLIFGGWLLGVGCVFISESHFTRAGALILENQADVVRVEGVISEIAGEEGSWKITLSRWSVDRGGAKKAEIEKEAGSGKLLCYLKSACGLKTGMRASILGKLKPLEPPRNPGSFDFRMYCMARGIGGTLAGEKAEILEGRYLWTAEAVRNLRERMAAVLDRTAEQDDAGIFKAALLGDRTGMNEELYDLYRRNGIAHLLAISGLHVSLIGMGLWKTLRRAGLGFGFSGAAAGGFLLLYGLLAGFSPSVIRAVTMLLFTFAAEYLGRTYDMITAMCASALLILIPAPHMLTQANFQLSFCAVSAIAFIGRPLIRMFGARGIFQAFLISLSVQMATAPVILFHSFEIPAYGIFLNLAVIPLMAFVVASGFLGIAAAVIWEPLGVALLGGGHFILAFYSFLCGAAERLPGSVILAGRPEVWRIAGYSLAMTAGIFYACCAKGSGESRRPSADKGVKAPRGRLGVSRGGALCLAAVCAAAFLFLHPLQEKGLSVTFLDVGQGDGIFFCVDGKRFLVDCGSSQDKQVGKNRLIPFLKSSGAACLDAVIVTHGDADHTSGIAELLKAQSGIKVKRLIMPLAGQGGEPYEEFRKLAEGCGAAVCYARRGMEISGGNTAEGASKASDNRFSLRVLSPPDGLRVGDRNAESLVLLLEYGNFRLLLTGDVETEGEREMTEMRLIPPVTVLKAAHHGSATSSTGAFLDASSPVYTVISYGEGNRYGHPADEVIDRLKARNIKIFTTAASGAVQITTDGDRMKIRGYLP